MTKYIDLHKLAETVGWQPVYVDEGYTSYEYLEKVRNIECLCHVLKLYDDLGNFSISFNSRIIVGEKLFGENSEDNLAYIVLKTLLENVPCEIRRKIGSNIILSGGITMLNGFYQRFLDEITYIANNNPEFMRLKGIKDDLHIHKIIFQGIEINKDLLNNYLNELKITVDEPIGFSKFCQIINNFD